MDCPAVTRALGLLIVTKIEVEAQLDQVINATGIWVRGRGSRVHDGLEDAKGYGFFTLDGGIFDPISFELPGEAPVQDGVSLGVRGISVFGEAIQVGGRCNHPPPPHA